MFDDRSAEPTDMSVEDWFRAGRARGALLGAIFPVAALLFSIVLSVVRSEDVDFREAVGSLFLTALFSGPIGAAVGCVFGLLAALPCVIADGLTGRSHRPELVVAAALAGVVALVSVVTYGLSGPVPRAVTPSLLATWMLVIVAPAALGVISVFVWPLVPDRPRPSIPAADLG